jgi:hypothetical protein
MAKEPFVFSEGNYPPFAVTRHDDGKRWIIIASQVELDHLKVNGEKMYGAEGVNKLTVGPTVFSSKAAPAILKRQKQYAKDMSIRDQLLATDFPSIEGLNFTVLDDPLVKIDGNMIAAFKSMISFRSARMREVRDAYDKKRSWIVSPDKLDGLLAEIIAAAPVIERARTRVFPEYRGITVRFDGENHYDAWGEMVHLVCMTFGHSGFSWKYSGGGYLTFPISEADAFDAWLEKMHAEINVSRARCTTEDLDDYAQAMIDDNVDDYAEYDASLRYDAPWMRIRSPYIEGFNVEMRRMGWIWVPQTKEWCIRVDGHEVETKVADDLAYVYYAMKTVLIRRPAILEATLPPEKCHPQKSIIQKIIGFAQTGKLNS